MLKIMVDNYEKILSLLQPERLAHLVVYSFLLPRHTHEEIFSSTCQTLLFVKAKHFELIDQTNLYLIGLVQPQNYFKIYKIMGQGESYVRGGGSHSHVPVPLNSKIQLYRSSKKLPTKLKNGGNSQATLGPGGHFFDTRGRKKIEWDIGGVNEQSYDMLKYSVKKLTTRNKIDISII